MNHVLELEFLEFVKHKAKQQISRGLRRDNRLTDSGGHMNVYGVY